MVNDITLISLFIGTVYDEVNLGSEQAETSFGRTPTPTIRGFDSTRQTSTTNGYKGNNSIYLLLKLFNYVLN